MAEATLRIEEWNLGLQAVARRCGVHVESVRRWATTGKTGIDEDGKPCTVILETIFIGDRMRTSERALEEFCAATNRGRRGRRPRLGLRTPTDRQRAVAAATADLDAEWRPKPAGRPRKRR